MKTTTQEIAPKRSLALRLYNTLDAMESPESRRITRNYLKEIILSNSEYGNESCNIDKVIVGKEFVAQTCGGKISKKQEKFPCRKSAPVPVFGNNNLNNFSKNKTVLENTCEILSKFSVTESTKKVKKLKKENKPTDNVQRSNVPVTTGNENNYPVLQNSTPARPWLQKAKRRKSFQYKYSKSKQKCYKPRIQNSPSSNSTGTEPSPKKTLSLECQSSSSEVHTECNAEIQNVSKQKGRENNSLDDEKILSFDYNSFLKFEDSLRAELRGKQPTPFLEEPLSGTANIYETVVQSMPQGRGILGDLCAGYSYLLHVFSYLTVPELLRASQVCHLWHKVANYPALWLSVCMRKTIIIHWKDFADVLCNHGTEHLDLRGMCIQGDSQTTWDNFCCVVDSIRSLQKLELSQCPVEVLERVADKCPNLTSLTAYSINGLYLRPNTLVSFLNLQKLQLEGSRTIQFSASLDAFVKLTSLKHLSLRKFEKLAEKQVDVIGSLHTLETLELGECSDFSPSFAKALSKLNKLQKLRLEEGQGEKCPIPTILRAVAKLSQLLHLELVNIDIRPGFDTALAKCTNIHQLLIIPMYKTHLAMTNKLLLKGLISLHTSLKYLKWGITEEVLTVTEMFIRRYGEATQYSKNNIPVRRPVPGLQKSELLQSLKLTSILPLSKLQTILETSLPKCCVHLKVMHYKSMSKLYLGTSENALQ